MLKLVGWCKEDFFGSMHVNFFAPEWEDMQNSFKLCMLSFFRDFFPLFFKAERPQKWQFS
jgi:hypothetical protein